MFYFTGSIFIFPEGIFTIPAPCQRHPFGEGILPGSPFPKGCLAVWTFGKSIFTLPGSMFSFPEGIFTLPESIFTFPDPKDSLGRAYLLCPKASLLFPKVYFAFPPQMDPFGKAIFTSPESMFTIPEDTFYFPEREGKKLKFEPAS